MLARVFRRFQRRDQIHRVKLVTTRGTRCPSVAALRHASRRRLRVGG